MNTISMNALLAFLIVMDRLPHPLPTKYFLGGTTTGTCP